MQKHPYVVWCEVYLHILNRMGVDHECNGRTDILIANAVLPYVVWPKKLVGLVRRTVDWFGRKGCLWPWPFSLQNSQSASLTVFAFVVILTFWPQNLQFVFYSTTASLYTWWNSHKRVVKRACWQAFVACISTGARTTVLVLRQNSPTTSPTHIVLPKTCGFTCIYFRAVEKTE